MQVQNSTSINEDLYSLSQGPLERYHSYTSCVVNGVRFRCKEHDDTLKTQCSGVCTEGDHDNENLIYYGVLTEILELSFLFDRKVFLFRCKWYNSSPRGRSICMDNNLTSINTSVDWYPNEPFIFQKNCRTKKFWKRYLVVVQYTCEDGGVLLVLKFPKQVMVLAVWQTNQPIRK